MKRSLVRLALLLTLAISPVLAQARWCSITGKTAGDALHFPPIARAAQIAGTVIERITFDSGGSVLQVEPLLGPPLIAKPVATQLMKWSIATDAKGRQPCQALVVANFAFSDSTPETETWTGSSLVKVSVQTGPLIIYSMPVVHSEAVAHAITSTETP